MKLFTLMCCLFHFLHKLLPFAMKYIKRRGILLDVLFGMLSDLFHGILIILVVSRLAALHLYPMGELMFS